jgi:3-deoxy-D-manno-octulosonic-acid transferase
VFVGGSLVEGGGQNMLEPAAFAKPVAFGPHTSDFAEEAGLLLERRAACLTPDGAAVTAFFRRALAGDEQTLTLGGRARAVVRSRAGAADRSLEVLRRALAESGA